MILRRTFDGIRVYIDTATGRACTGSPGKLPPPRRKFRPVEDLEPLNLRRYAMRELALFRQEAAVYANADDGGD